MKKIILILSLLLMSIVFADEISGKRIQVRGTAKREISPTIAKIQLTINTNNEDLDKATELNNEVLEKYKSLLKELNISYNNITSIDYNTNKYYNYNDVVLNKGQKEYETNLKVDLSSVDTNVLKNLISTLAKNDIYTIKKNKNNSYGFNIISKSSTQKEAYQNALNKFNSIKAKLIENKIDSTFINLVGFNNKTINLEKIENKKVEIYNVSHQLELNTNDFKDLGKIIDLANILNIRTNNFIEYDIENKSQLEDELYQSSYLVALNKAQTILNKTNLTLKKPVTITDNSTGMIKPYTAYFNGRYYYNTNNVTDENIKESSASIKEKLKELNTVIIPEKKNVEKHVYIEFEMN